MKKISLIFIALIITIVYFNENLISAFAEEFSKDFIKVGEIYKSGDVINVQEAPGCQLNNVQTCKYTYYVRVLKMKDNYLDDPNYDESKKSEYVEEYLEAYSNDGKFTFEQYKGKDIYWKVVEVDKNSYYGILYATIESFDYVEPKLEMNCEKDVLNVKESTSCDLNLKYNYDVTNLSFNIDSEHFEISNFKSLDSWQVSQNDGIYSLTNGITGDSKKKDLATTKIATFTLTASEVNSSTNLENNIIVNNIKYTDVVTSNKLKETSDTLNIKINKEKVKDVVVEKNEEEISEVKQDANEEIENPPTGVKNIIFIVILLSILGFTLLKFSKKYKLFQKI